MIITTIAITITVTITITSATSIANSYYYCVLLLGIQYLSETSIRKGNPLRGISSRKHIAKSFSEEDELSERPAGGHGIAELDYY